MDISSSEWEVMRVLWAQGESKSSQIYQFLKPKWSWSESTVKTLLGRLVAKGVVDTRREGRSFIYQAVISEKEALGQAGQLLLSRVCQKKQARFLGQLLSDIPMTANDIAYLQAILSEKQSEVLDKIACQCGAGQCACSQTCMED